MTTYKYRLLTVLCCLALFFTPGTLAAQNNKDAAKIAGIKAMVLNQQYNFEAQTVTPLTGRLRQLTGGYDLQVSKDQVISSLPYFGRAYSAPIGNAAGGIEFTSKDFEYSLTEKKKGGWDIAIKYKDTPGVQQMQLSVFTNGTASLQVTSTNRQSISFYGYIAAPDKKK